MKLPAPRLDGLANVGAGFEEMRRLAERHELGDQAFRLTQRSADLHQPLLIMVVGEGNFGKSSLVNALLGTPVAPVGIVPTTATVDLYANSTPHGAEIRWSDDDEPTPTTVDEAREVLASAKSQGREVLQVRWNVDAEWPARSDVALVDTPGISQFRDKATRSTTKMYRSEGLELERRDQFEQYFFRADAVVWCIRADLLESESIFQDLAAVRGQDKVTLGLLTCIDRIPVDRRSEVIDRARSAHGNYLSTFITVSAKDDGTLRESETINHLRAELDAQVVDRSDVVKQDAALRALATEGQELANAVDTLARGLHDGLKLRRTLLKEADRGAGRVLRGARTRVQGVLDRQERAAKERASSIMAGASSSSAARSALASRAVELPATRTDVSAVLTDVTSAGASLMEERRQHIKWTTIVVGGGENRSKAAGSATPSAPTIALTTPEFDGLDSHGVWDFAMQFDFLKGYAQSAILKQANAAISKAFATMSDQTDRTIKRYEESLRFRLTDQVEASFADHFGMKAPDIAVQVLALLASAYALIDVLHRAEPVAATIEKPDLLAGATERAAQAARTADSAFRFVVADLISRGDLAATGPATGATPWLNDLMGAASAGSPSAISQVKSLITADSKGSTAHLSRLLLALWS